MSKKTNEKTGVSVKAKYRYGDPDENKERRDKITREVLHFLKYDDLPLNNDIIAMTYVLCVLLDYYEESAPNKQELREAKKFRNEVASFIKNANSSKVGE